MMNVGLHCRIVGRPGRARGARPLPRLRARARRRVGDDASGDRPPLARDTPAPLTRLQAARLPSTPAASPVRSAANRSGSERCGKWCPTGHNDELGLRQALGEERPVQSRRPGSPGARRRECRRGEAAPVPRRATGRRPRAAVRGGRAGTGGRPPGGGGGGGGGPFRDGVALPQEHRVTLLRLCWARCGTTEEARGAGRGSAAGRGGADRRGGRGRRAHGPSRRGHGGHHDPRRLQRVRLEGWARRRTRGAWVRPAADTGRGAGRDGGSGGRPGRGRRLGLPPLRRRASGALPDRRPACTPRAGAGDGVPRNRPGGARRARAADRATAGGRAPRRGVGPGRGPGRSTPFARASPRWSSTRCCPPERRSICGERRCRRSSVGSPRGRRRRRLARTSDIRARRHPWPRRRSR